MNTAIFGANGPTGRLLTQAILDAGHEARAVTRRPAEFPITHPRLTVVSADALDPAAVDGAIEGTDAVLSTLGVPYTRSPIDIYSASATFFIDSMRRHGARRLVVVSSSATHEMAQPAGGFLLTKVMQPLVKATIGKTTYTDMQRMEAIVGESGLDWTVMRPSGLFDHAGATAYELSTDHAPAPFTARADLAASIADQLVDDRFLGRFVAVSTTAVRPSLLALVWREALSRR